MRSDHYSTRCCSKKMYMMCSIFSSFLIIHLILVPCHAATVFQLPLKQYRKADPTTFYSYHRLERAHVVRDKRQASSTDQVKLDSMRGNLHGLSTDGYYVDVNIGNPPQKVLIDTGSANFAIACEPDKDLDIYFHRENSSSYEEDGKEIYVPYTEGEWTGTLGRDETALTSAAQLSTTANIACITSSHAFYTPGADWQGILGLGYSELARPDTSVTPFWDSLLADHPDLEDVFSIQLCGSSFIHTKEEPLRKGSLILGGVLPSLAKSEFFYTPIYKRWYYEVIITDILVDGQSLMIDCKEYNMDKTIVDSGTTTIRLPVKVFSSLTAVIDREFQKKGNVLAPDASFYSGIGTLCFSDMAKPFSVFPVISFSLMETENTSFVLNLSPQHYLRPVEKQSIGGEIVESCVKFGFTPSNTGAVLGAVLMEAFYVVFDRANNRIGFAQTTCPLPDPPHKILNETIQGPFPTNGSSQCAFKKPETSDDKFLTAAYVILGISLVVIIPLVLLCILRGCRSCQSGDPEPSETQGVFEECPCEDY